MNFNAVEKHYQQSLLSAQPEPEKPKRKRKPAAPKEPKPVDPFAPSTREIFRIVNFYLHNVRQHDKREQVGIFRQIQQLCKKGIPISDVALAAQNYSKSEFVRSIPEQNRHSIRRFFMPERIKQWARHHENAARDRSLVALERLAEEAAKGNAAPPSPANSFIPPAVPLVGWKNDVEEEEEPCLADI